MIEAGESVVAGLSGLIGARGDAALSTKLGKDSQSRALLIGSEGIAGPDIYRRIMAGEI